MSTFTPRTGKTSGEVVQIVPCAKNKWRNWWDFLFYVVTKDAGGIPRLPPTISQFKVRKGDVDEDVVPRASKMSSCQDLVEELIACGVWPLAHGWEVGEVKLCLMPF